MKTTAVPLSLVASSVAAGDDPNIAGGVNKVRGKAGGNKNPDIAGGFVGDRAGGRKKECFFKPSKCLVACTLTFVMTENEFGRDQDTNKCVIPEFTKGTEECVGGDCDPFKEVTKSSADVTKAKDDVCGTFTATTKSSCEQGIQDKEDAKDPAAFFTKCQTAAGNDAVAQSSCATKKTALEKPHEELDQDAKDKKLLDKMKGCVAATNGKTFASADVAAKKIAKDADAKSCRDKVIDEAVGEAAAIGDFINKDELTKKAERDYDQQDRIADAKGGNPCSRLAVGSDALAKCTKFRVTDVAAIAVLDTEIKNASEDAKIAKIAAKDAKEAECSNTKDPKGELMKCLKAGTKTKDAGKAAAVIDTAVKSGKTTDEAVGSDFANMFKDIEREFDQQKETDVLTALTGGCKSKSSKELSKKCFDDTMKTKAAEDKNKATECKIAGGTKCNTAKPLAELKREVEEAAVDGKITHFL